MRARRTDKDHKEVLKALRGQGYVCRSLHAAGDGLEDILVGVLSLTRYKVATHFWVLVEVKTIERESTGYYRHTKAQKEWYDRTVGFPRLIVFSPEDAVAKMRIFYG